MRTKIALIVVLASFLAVAAFGTGLAGADPLAENTSAEPGAAATTAIPSLQAPACSNGVDDDGDGLVDLADPDCTSPSDTTEGPVAPAGASPATPLVALDPSHGDRRPIGTRASSGLAEGRRLQRGPLY